MSTDPPVSSQRRPDGDRIAKVLSRAGVASRREAERLIASGRVKVDGVVIDSPALNVTATARITVDGTPVGPPDPPRLWLFHKPAGLVTTARDEKGRETIFDTLPGDMPRVMPVGRLDLTSEGLLILTNDGAVKRRLELPTTGWLRRYRVRIRGAVSEERLETLRRGLTVDGVAYQPMEVTFDRQQGANAWLTVALREGKNREIRRAMEAIGVTVNRLIRVSYGPFQLGKLPQGEVEEVRPRVVRDQLGLDEAAPGTARTVRTRSPARAATKSRAGRDALSQAKPGPASPAGKSPNANAKPNAKHKARSSSRSKDKASTAAEPGTRNAPRTKPTGRHTAAPARPTASGTGPKSGPGTLSRPASGTGPATGPATGPRGRPGPKNRKS